MDKSNVLLISSILGISILLLLINLKQPIETDISSISEKQIGKSILLLGKISSIKNYENGFSVLSIKDYKAEEIQVICNCNSISGTLKEIQTKNKTLKIRGKVEKYQNTLQINANKITYQK